MTALVKGSLSAMARQGNVGLAEAFLNADTVILVDTSGSMNVSDGRDDRRSRYERACDELARLQGSLQGRIAVISFSTTALFCPAGTPAYLGGGTNLAGALEFVQIADGVVDRFIVISDGQPDNEGKALKVAAQFTTTIDTIFIGAPGSAGADFLRRLAAARGGQAVTIAGAARLAERVERLLLGAAA